MDISFKIINYTEARNKEEWEQINENPKKFQYFGENMSFLVDEIKVTSSIEKHNHLFLYTDIQDFILCFKPVESNSNLDIAIVRWKVLAETYQFTLQINSSLEKKQMIEVLKYLYSNKIAIKEIDEYGKKIYLLNTKEKKIEEKYLHLIDEIGKNED